MSHVTLSRSRCRSSADSDTAEHRQQRLDGIDLCTSNIAMESEPRHRQRVIALNTVGPRSTRLVFSRVSTRYFRADRSFDSELEHELRSILRRAQVQSYGLAASSSGRTQTVLIVSRLSTSRTSRSIVIGVVVHIARSQRTTSNATVGVARTRSNDKVKAAWSR
jgi:hypothetical protein